MTRSIRWGLMMLGIAGLPLTGLAAKPVSRLEVATAIANDLYGTAHDTTCFFDIVQNVPTEYDKLFADVSKSETYADTLCMGMRAGYINGHRDGTFRPLGTINVAEATAMIAKAYRLHTPTLETPRGPWYGPALDRLRTLGVVPANVRPDSPVTDTMLSAMLERASALHAETMHAMDNTDAEEEELEFGNFPGSPWRSPAASTQETGMRDSTVERDLSARRDAFVSRRTLRARLLAEEQARELRARNAALTPLAE